MPQLVHQGAYFVGYPATGFGGYDPLDPDCLSALEQLGRALAGALAQFFKTSLDGFARSFLGTMPTRVGIRESRRIVGRATLSASDLLEGASPPESVAFATWPMELRERTSGPRLRFPETEAPCGIPMGCLMADEMPGLFAAGRCISATHEAQASIRVIGTCLATGEAAGLAAAHMASLPIGTPDAPLDPRALARRVNDLRDEVIRPDENDARFAG